MFRKSEQIAPAAARERRLVFVVPTLGKNAAQDEDVVQLLIVVAAALEHALASPPSHDVRATLLSVAPDTSGWRIASTVFSEAALARISVEQLPEACTPSLAVGSHKAAYDFFEFLKARSFDEVHTLDSGGIGYYATLARALGLYFLDTVFAAHVVGGRFFRAQADDALLGDVDALADDLLERGSIERADVVFVHDRKAWEWYAGKIERRAQTRIYDAAFRWMSLQSVAARREPARRASIVYYGRLGADAGLPLFCDTVERVLPRLDRPVEIVLIGSAAAMGGLDAVSYVRLRSARWGVPVIIRRDLSIADELALVSETAGVVFVDTRKRGGLRARLIAGSGLPVLHVTEDEAGETSDVTVCSDNPGTVAGAIERLLLSGVAATPRELGAQGVSAEPLALGQLCRSGCLAIPVLDDFPSVLPLEAPAREPKVSVCVTHFNRPEKLRTALESLRHQTYSNFEVIVVDDGSPSAVRAQLDELAQEIAPRGWRIVTQENRYLGAARNFAARHATGEYLLFMDDDNVAKPNEIATLVAVACRTGAEIVTTFYDGFTSEGALAAGVSIMRFTPYGSDPALGVFTNCFGDANALYARGAFERLGGFTEDYGTTHEDWELFCRAALAGVAMICIPEPLFWYRMDRDGMFAGSRKRLHESANRRRHVRPHLEALPHWQAKLVQVMQGLTTELPVAPVIAATRAAAADLRPRESRLPYARVAVIMRTKDRPHLLARAIRSVLEQSFRDWVLVIVNDGGKPESVALVVDGAADELMGRVVVIHHPGALGMQTAVNAGIARCDSDLIAIHDDDDTWEPTFLARTVSHFDEHGWRANLGGVVTRTQVVVEEIGEGGEIEEIERFPFDADLDALSLADLAVENRFPPISFLFRRAAFDVVGPFRNQHGPLGDWDFHLRLLARFDIDVVKEPLANYHHRVKGTSGAYGNSVHADLDVHKAKRADLVNDALRGTASAGDGLSLAPLLAMGDLHHRLSDEQRREFQRLHDYVSCVEQKLDRVAGTVGVYDFKPRRNLLRNGDFRDWQGPGQLQRSADGNCTYGQIYPGFVLSFDGADAGYRCERRFWNENGRLPFGKTYLHIAREVERGDGTWFTLECPISRVAQLSGRSLCVSGTARLLAAPACIEVGGRYELGDRVLTWPSSRVSISGDFQPWSVTIPSPKVEPRAMGRRSHARILLKLPHDQAFEFDVTDLQVELGTSPSPFEYRRRFTAPLEPLRDLVRERFRQS